MKDRRLVAEKPESMDDLVAQRDWLVVQMNGIDHRLESDLVVGIEREYAEDKWIGYLRSYEFICQKIAKVA